MEFVAVAKSGVHIYTFKPGEGIPEEPVQSFPAVPTGEGCNWSPDGSLLGCFDASTGGVTVYNANNGYARQCSVAPVTQGPIRSFYFSPLGNHLVTLEYYKKSEDGRGGDNIGLWDTKTGALRWSFILKQTTEMNWPALKWTSLETHCCRMVADGVIIMPGTASKDDAQQKLSVPNIIAFEIAKAGVGSPHIAVCVPEAKGAPARCMIYRLDDLKKPLASKSMYKVQTVKFYWNNTGTALLVLTSMDVDDTGKQYYGSTNLYFMRPDGQDDSIVASADSGPVHDVCWCPTQDEFLLIHGQLPCEMTLHDGKKAKKLMLLGTAHRNTIKWNTFGRFLLLGGFGQLKGDMDFWDKTGKRKFCTTHMECCVVCDWAPDGRHFLGATTAPRMRVDNKIQFFSYYGTNLGTIPFEMLIGASWRPRPRGAFPDRPASPGRAQSAAAADAKAAAAPKKQAYRPPGARGAGGTGLTEMLRQELGSGAAETTTTATKVFSASSAGPAARQIPGMAPVEAQGASAASGSSRAARRKKAKEAADEAKDTEAKEKLAAALSQTKVEFSPPSRSAEAPAPAPTPAPAAKEDGGGGGDGGSGAQFESGNAEVDKEVRKLRKKVRDIEKLKEKPPSELDPLQAKKINDLPGLLQQLRDLGAEP
eukprot:gnl/TRDRNA2_/TRDRNA2_186328_c0_seq1.p1 gnl/TRDRNA2_/TRDRNA2_186328_c0~~gnl/TRDRNA2_/TRDRNA2_186328_c0_seq1.p1  ORF type:complete len:648 (-),score=147.96 gnl/TRDRNA2_/TRDRNA2_186328_c0_seq1:253-2196(-)